MTEAEALSALISKHARDVCVPHCKNGASYGGALSIMDLWVMRKSWAHPQIIGYEVKVSRADFLKDEKWTAYLPMCNLFYFACPWGLIQPAEVPYSAGLCWITSTGNRCVVKKKAPHREIAADVTVDVMRYILMARARIDPDSQAFASREERAASWEQWLRSQKAKADLGYRVSKHTQETVRDLERKCNALTSRMEGYDRVREWMAKVGLDPEQPPRWSHNIDRMEAHLTESFPDLAGDLARLADSVSAVRTRLENIGKERRASLRGEEMECPNA